MYSEIISDWKRRKKHPQTVLKGKRFNGMVPNETDSEGFRFS